MGERQKKNWGGGGRESLQVKRGTARDRLGSRRECGSGKGDQLRDTEWTSEGETAEERREDTEGRGEEQTGG